MKGSLQDNRMDDTSGGQPASYFRLLVHGYDPDDPDIYMAPGDYLTALDDVEHIRTLLWDLMAKVTQGPMTAQYGALQYHYDRMDLQAWRNLAAPPPLLQPEATLASGPGSHLGAHDSAATYAAAGQSA